MMNDDDQRRGVLMTDEPNLTGFQRGTHVGPVDYPGLIFRIGVDPRVPQHLFRLGDDYLDIGNYEYTLRAANHSITYRYGFVAIKLGRMMPHMVLDATKNDFLGATTLPVGFHRTQVLSLEGGFDEHFTLYCPRQYERDALYVFTPDLMALLIDEAGVVDVEVIDDWVFLYRFGGFDLDEAATMSKLFRIIDTVGEKMLSRTSMYADSRMHDSDAAAPAPAGRMSVNQISAQGVRLKPAMPRVVKVAVTACALVIGVPLVAALWFSVVQAVERLH
jgi:hypothetical protein